MITAQVVLINEEGLVLGVSIEDNHNDFGLVGGKMDKEDDGDPMKTAIRECKEETGLYIYDLNLIFAIHKDGNMGFTYLAKYIGGINHDEPHVVKWVPFNTLIAGSFGRYNQLVSESLDDMGVKYKMCPTPTKEYLFAVSDNHYTDTPTICLTSREFWEKNNEIPYLAHEEEESEDIHNLLRNSNISIGECDETSFEVFKGNVILTTKEEIIEAMTSAGFVYDKLFDDEINN